MNQIPADLIHRTIDSLESIANSLSTLAEDTKTNKELKQSLMLKVIYFYKIEKVNIPILVSYTSDIALDLFDKDGAQEVVDAFPEAKNNLYILVGKTEFKLNI
ncbi:hypothetical protein [Enterococcus alishanensis]